VGVKKMIKTSGFTHGHFGLARRYDDVVQDGLYLGDDAQQRGMVLGAGREHLRSFEQRLRRNAARSKRAKQSMDGITTEHLPR